MNRDRAENIGFWLGVAVFVIAGAALYLIHGYLTRHLDREWAGIILAIPAFFAVFIIFPVKNRYVAFASRQYCSKHGHLLEVSAPNGKADSVLCKRCYMVMMSEESPSLSPPD